MNVDIAAVPNLVVRIFQIVFGRESSVAALERPTITPFLEIRDRAYDEFDAVDLAVADVESS